jgi:hypothetical protein
MKFIGCAVLVVAFCSGLPGVADPLMFNVSIDTSALQGASAGPFSLDVQLVDGSGVGDGNNAVALSSFVFAGGGQPTGVPTATGDVFGVLSSTIVLRDSTFFTEFTQAFQPGSDLSFSALTTTNLDSVAPDALSISILDSTGAAIPTLGLSSTGADIFLGLDIGTGTSPYTFASDPTRSPAAGGPPLDIPAPDVQVLPEPSCMPLLGIGFGLLGCAKLLRSRASKTN